MKIVAAVLLSCAALCCAQDAKPEAKDPKTQEIKRLESVTWDLSTHKLVWLVSKGSVVDGEFVPSIKVKYEVSPDDAFMAHAGDTRSFGASEAAALHQLLDMLSIYCVESVVWWDRGQAGGPGSDTSEPGLVTKPERPVQQKPTIAPGSVPVKVGEQKQKRPSGQLVAAKGD
jgi:hypothetical protein